jgi:hypothetical protein
MEMIRNNRIRLHNLKLDTDNAHIEPLEN